MSLFDKRRAARINDSLVVAYSHLKDFELEKAIQHIEQGGISPYFPTPADNQQPTTINISATGIAFAADHIFEKNDMLAISLVLNRSQHTIHIIGKVVEFLPDPEMMTGYARINYEYISQYDQLRLTNYIIVATENSPAFKSIS